MKLTKGITILRQRLARQGGAVTAWWAADHAVRILTGANIRRLARITPHLYVGGQHRRRGLRRLRVWGVTAIVNMRIEFEDDRAGVAPFAYLHLPVVDDHAPTLEQLEEGVAFIKAEIARGGAVYVHCGSGIGRAATMAAAYLVSTGLGAEQAWTTIQAARPFIRPTAVQVKQIERFAVGSRAAE